MKISMSPGFLPFKGIIRQCSSKTKEESLWDHLDFPPRNVVQIVEHKYEHDTDPNKIILVDGGYRNEYGERWLLPSVAEAEKRLYDRLLNKEYNMLEGLKEFNQQTAELIFGADSEIICDKRNATVQTLSTSNSIHICAQFLKKFYPGRKCVYFQKPTWFNYVDIFKMVGFETIPYRYYNEDTGGLDWKGCLEDINNMCDRSLIFLQASGHNPTGRDISKDQWCELPELIKKKKLYPLFSASYQGLISGDCDEDLFAVRLFAKENIKFSVFHSFTNNMAVFGQKTGTLTFVTESKEEAERLMYNLGSVTSGIFFSTPVRGARIVEEVLKDKELRKMWLDEIKTMHRRLHCTRIDLKYYIEEEGSVQKWDHIIDQKGFFCFTNLNAEQVDRMANEYHIHMGVDGMISIPTITANNVKRVAKAMNDVTSC